VAYEQFDELGLAACAGFGIDPLQMSLHRVTDKHNSVTLQCGY